MTRLMNNFIFAIVAIGLITLSCTKKEDRVSTPTGQTNPSAAANESGDAHKGIGVGPVSKLDIPPEIDAKMVTSGKAAFESKCSACHKFGERYVGPDLKSVTERRNPEWIMNMMLNPIEMTQKDETAKALLGEYMTQMTFQNVSQDEARQILEYFRSIDKK